MATRDGQSVRIFCYDLSGEDQPILGARMDEDGDETVEQWNIDGTYEGGGYSCGNSDYDLCMIVEEPDLALMSDDDLVKGAARIADDKNVHLDLRILAEAIARGFRPMAFFNTAKPAPRK